VVLEVGAVVELRELDEHVDHFRLVRAAQTGVFRPSVYSPDALEHELRRERVLNIVSSERIELAHAGHQADHFARALAVLSDGVHDALPHVGCVVPVQVDEVLDVLLSLRLCVHFLDDVQVFLVGWASDYVDHVVELDIGVLGHVLLLVLLQQAVVRHLLEVEQELAVRKLILTQIGVCVLLIDLGEEVLLTSRTEVLR